MSHTDVAVILAAGNGKRLAARSGELPKPLVPLHGRPLLEHVMRGAHEAGINRFVIVVGYRGQVIQEWYESQPLLDVYVTWVENPDYHKDNGISVLKAKELIHEPFLLMMADHVFEAETARALLRQPLRNDEVILAVDRNIDRDIRYRRCDQGSITRSEHRWHWEESSNYNALDTGMFLCSPTLFQSLEKRYGQRELLVVGRSAADGREWHVQGLRHRSKHSGKTSTLQRRLSGQRSSQPNSRS